MKKQIITLTAAALFAFGCGPSGQPKTATDTFNEADVSQADSITHNDTAPPDLTETEAETLHDPETLSFDIQPIDSVTYYAAKANADVQTEELEKITDLKQAKEMLKGRVEWGKYNDEYKFLKDDRGELVYKIRFRTGETISYGDDSDEMEFVAYYPQEDILFLEGGHSSSMIYNLTTGEETHEVGDPDYRHYSPSKQYRFNGYYSGQIDVYFIQVKRGAQYKTVIELDFVSGSEFSERMCLAEYLPDVFWQNDTTLYMAASCYNYPEQNETRYYQLILKK
jgi:hypothetical protein